MWNKSQNENGTMIDVNGSVSQKEMPMVEYNLSEQGLLTISDEGKSTQDSLRNTHHQKII